MNRDETSDAADASTPAASRTGRSRRPDTKFGSGRSDGAVGTLTASQSVASSTRSANTDPAATSPRSSKSSKRQGTRDKNRKGQHQRSSDISSDEEIDETTGVPGSHAIAGPPGTDPARGEVQEGNTQREMSREIDEEGGTSEHIPVALPAEVVSAEVIVAEPAPETMDEEGGTNNEDTDNNEGKTPISKWVLVAVAIFVALVAGIAIGLGVALANSNNGDSGVKDQQDPATTDQPSSAPTATPRPTMFPTVTMRPTIAPTSSSIPTSAPTKSAMPSSQPTPLDLSNLPCLCYYYTQNVLYSNPNDIPDRFTPEQEKFFESVYLGLTNQYDPFNRRSLSLLEEDIEVKSPNLRRLPETELHVDMGIESYSKFQGFTMGLNIAYSWKYCREGHSTDYFQAYHDKFVEYFDNPNNQASVLNSLKEEVGLTDATGLERVLNAGLCDSGNRTASR